MNKCNIRTFKVLLVSGHITFQSKTNDSRGCIACDSIRDLAENVKSEVVEFLRTKKGKMIEISIDLRPYHDIECPSDLMPRRCLPLTDKEAREFWKQFKICPL